MLRLAVQLLPPVLRNSLLLAFLRAFTAPLRQLHQRFTEYRDRVSGRLDVTAGVQYIEKALNDAFFLSGGQIYIVSVPAPVSGGTPYLHLIAEGQRPRYFGLRGERPYYMGFSGEGKPESGDPVNFNVYVPTFLCTSPDPGQDRYGGTHIGRIRNLLDYYKPAGRKYGIILYDYE